MKKENKEIEDFYSPEQFKKMSTRDALAYWLALPSKFRNPPTQKKLAELLSVSQERLCHLKRDNKLIVQVDEYRKIFFKQFTSNIILAIKIKAEGGDPRAQKLWLQYIEDFKETTKQEKDVKVTREFVFLIDDKKREELLNIIEKEKQKKYLTYERIEKTKKEQLEKCNEKISD